MAFKATKLDEVIKKVSAIKGKREVKTEHCYTSMLRKQMIKQTNETQEKQPEKQDNQDNMLSQNTCLPEHTYYLQDFSYSYRPVLTFRLLMMVSSFHCLPEMLVSKIKRCPKIHFDGAEYNAAISSHDKHTITLLMLPRIKLASASLSYQFL